MSSLWLRDRELSYPDQAAALPIPDGVDLVLAVTPPPSSEERIESIEIYNAGTETEAPDDEVRAVTAVFRDAGIDVEFEPGLMRLSQDPLPWVVYFSVAAPILTFLSAFAKKTGELAAEDAWPVLKDVVRRIVAARRDSEQGQIELRDVESRTTVQLLPGLPDEAYQRLFELDWSRAGKGKMGWDARRKEWIDLDGKPVPELDQ
jgi:hypothetical protein